MPQTALISAYTKDNALAAFALALRSQGWNFLGSAGTKKFLADKKVPCRDISEIVGPPILGHRVVTLSREIHAGILADLDKQEDMAELERLGIPAINLVCVSLYPLEEELKREGCTIESVREKTDVGGIALLHAAAKSGRFVISHPMQYAKVLKFLKSATTPSKRRLFLAELAADAELYAGDYLSAAGHYLAMASEAQ